MPSWPSGETLLAVAGALLLAALLERARRGAAAVVGVAAALVVSLVLLAQAGSGFDGYDTDLWTYALIVERAASGADLQGVEPFRLEPPPSPQVASIWLALGSLRRLTDWPLTVILHGTALLGIALLTYSVWRLAGALGIRIPGRGAAVVLFWLSFPETWGAVALGRNLALGTALLAAARLARPSRGAANAALSGALLGLGFHLHLFGGVIGVVLALVVLLALWRERPRPATGELLAMAATLVLVAAGPLAGAMSTFGRIPGGAHVWRPDQIVIHGWRVLDPESLGSWFPPSLLVLALPVLVLRVDERLRGAQRLARIGFALSALALVTPAYHLLVRVLGGWMVPRMALLAVPWLAAAIGWEASSVRRGFAIAAGLAVAWLAAPRLVALGDELVGARHLAFSRAAQLEAEGLRPLLHGQTYLSVDHIAYGLAAPSLGLPFVVPPGHGSPFADDVRRRRHLHTALAVDTEACWTAFFARYPGPRFLVTPAPGASVERLMWMGELGGREPEDVRERLIALGWLRPRQRGDLFRVDALEPPGVVDHASHDEGLAQFCASTPFTAMTASGGGGAP
jgi:hypothetical protein